MPIESTAHEPTTPALKQMLPDAALSLGSIGGLRESVASQAGCIGFLSVMEACYEVGPAEIDVSIKLAGNTMGKCTLSSAEPQCTLRGGLFGLVADATVSFDFTNYVLTISGEACVPAKGCTTGTTSVHL
jgi:hypothetical protein